MRGRQHLMEEEEEEMVQLQARPRLQILLQIHLRPHLRRQHELWGGRQNGLCMR